MEIIKFKKNTFIVEDNDSLAIFNGNNMCRIEKKESFQSRIEFIKYIEIAKTFDEIKNYICLNNNEINMFINMFYLFVEKVEVRQRILLLGKTGINSLLYEKLNSNDQYAVLIEKLEKEELKIIRFFDLVIISQNTKMSPLYRIVNSYCSINNINIFNICPENESVVIGPYLKNNGSDLFCYDCFCKREEINNLNQREVQIKNKIAILNEYDDTRYSYFHKFELSDNVSDAVVNFLNGKEEYNFEGIYRMDKKGGKNLTFVHIYAIPFCKKCNKSMKFLYSNDKRFEREQTSDIGKDFIDIKYGIFRKLISSKTVLNDEGIFYYTIQIPCIFNAINNIMDDVFSYNIAGGVSVNEKQAMAKAIGEAVERYCLEAYDINDLIKTSISNIVARGGRVIKGLQLFDDWQYEEDGFPFVKIDNHMDIYWTKAKDIFNEHEVFVPASFVFSRFRKVYENNNIGFLTTSGTAASVDFNSAVLYGIYELIERDCTMITWLQRLKVPRVLIDDGMIYNEEVRKSVELLHSNGINFDIYYITLDLKIPCFLVVGYSNNKELPAKLIGAGCRMNKDEALIRALEEIIQGCGWSSLQKEPQKFALEDDFKNIKGFRDRVSLYAVEEMSREFEFLKSENVILYSSIMDVKCSLEQEYNSCLNILKNHNMQLVVKDLTTSDVNQLGFSVVKVIIPELQQIEADYNFRYLNCKRTREVPKKLGYEDLAENSKMYNRAPHPFP